MSSDPQAGLFEYTAGLDIGNGYVKGVIEDRGSDTAAKESDVAVDIIDMHSVAARYCIAGTPADCRAKLARLRDAGVQNVCMSLSASPDLPAYVRGFGEHVLPALR